MKVLVEQSQLRNVRSCNPFFLLSWNHGIFNNICFPTKVIFFLYCWSFQAFWYTFRLYWTIFLSFYTKYTLVFSLIWNMTSKSQKINDKSNTLFQHCICFNSFPNFNTIGNILQKYFELASFWHQNTLRRTISIPFHHCLVMAFGNP